MEYVKLGSTGLDVSRICLGCMSFGAPNSGPHPWTLDEDASQAMIRRAIEAGVNFFDTANIYSAGTSEEIVGRALKKYARREDIVLATKVAGPMRRGPNAIGLSRKAIMTEIDNSLRRLGTDYVDLYQIHRFDPTTPIEETMRALHDVVQAGKARYIGASSMYAWQFAKALYTADLHGWTRFVTMQNHYNLLYREEEREMLPLCVDQGIGVIPWSPLARGLLTRDWDETTHRGNTDSFGQFLKTGQAESDASTTSLASRTLYLADDKSIVDQVGRIAADRGVSRAQIALAWVSNQPAVTAPIVGTTRPEHLDDALAALDLQLTPEENAALEDPYRPRSVVGIAMG